MATWSAAPQPNRFEVMGTDDDDVRRVVIGWEDERIINQWLEIRLLTSPSSGVVTTDLFYFGNAPGETGDSATNTLVNATDIVATRNNKRGPFNPATIEDRYDFNRDGLVNATDVLFARDHVTSPFAALPLISPSAAAASAVARAAVPRAPLPTDNGCTSLVARAGSSLYPSIEQTPLSRQELLREPGLTMLSRRQSTPRQFLNRLEVTASRRSLQDSLTDVAFSALATEPVHEIKRYTDR